MGNFASLQEALSLQLETFLATWTPVLNEQSSKSVALAENLTSLLKLVAALPAIYATYKIGYLFYIRRKYAHIPGPPTKGLLGFFAGNIVDYKEYIYNGKTTGDFLLECHLKYGKTFKFQTYDSKIVVTTLDRDAIREICVSDVASFPKTYGTPPSNMAGVRMLGNGLLNEHRHEDWKHRRHVINHGLHRIHLMDHIEQFNSKADMVLQKLNLVADDKTYVDLFELFSKLTLDAISEIAFGEDIDSISGNNDELYDMLKKTCYYVQVILVHPLGRISPEYRRILSEYKVVNRKLRKIAADLLTKRLESTNKNPNDKFDDILNGIINSQKHPISAESFEVMIDDVLTFFLAGQETTANSLGFTFAQLGRHPEILAKCREEVERVVGQNTRIDNLMVNELKYISRVFKESLRLFPVAPFLLRKKNIKPFCIENKYDVPKNTPILISPQTSHWHPENFPNPTEFNPDRFDKEKGHVIENYTYFPFSLGPRNCMGQSFAQTEAIIMIAKLIQRFDFEVDPKQKLIVEQAFTLKPKGGVPVLIKNVN